MCSIQKRTLYRCQQNGCRVTVSENVSDGRHHFGLVGVIAVSLGEGSAAMWGRLSCCEVFSQGQFECSQCLIIREGSGGKGENSLGWEGSAM